ncbi:MAG TPA: hypothetical protein VNN80_25255 [Polyangiaceae bacterium]|jgi:hypothetical protein|nr:hypothetical protein [Polyangiaceae bacterium]
MDQPHTGAAVARRLRVALGEASLPVVLAVAVTLIGLGLRVEHALTFDGPGRGSDYAVYVEGVRWMRDHHRPFNFTETVNYQVRYQPPLWYALGAIVLGITRSERAIAGLAVLGWLVRQGLLARILKDAGAPRWSALVALALHALLPLGVLIDGKVNPEGLHATLFLLAVYFLWRMERELSTGVRLATAAAFGVTAGLAVLTKGTSATLVVTAALVLAYQLARSLPATGWALSWRRLVRPALLAAGLWCLVAGWWLVPNLLKYGHPFPHVWDLEGAAQHPELTQPVLYRRPLGWALPFDWKPYLRFPIITSPSQPRPNFWSNIITGTWSDFYNRGFCRLEGGPKTDYVWGGAHGALYSGPQWAVTLRCVAHFRKMLVVGLGITSAVVIGWAATLWLYLRTGRRGSLVLPLSCALGAFFIMLFALTYPFDGSAVLNPRYLMPISTPLIACFGLALGELQPGRLSRWLHGAALAAISTNGVLLCFERFAR